MIVNQKFISQNLIVAFFAVTLVLIGAEYFSNTSLVFIFKPILMPLLIALYWIESRTKCKWYLSALIFAFISNVLLLFPNTILLSCGIFAFLFYRIATILAVIKNGDRVAMLPVTLATIPFLVMFSYLVLTMVSPKDPSFYATVLNAIIFSVFSGIGLSSYVMNDNLKNSWLIINTLLSTFLAVIFLFDNFYLSFTIFKPISALVFTLSHYAFYCFMMEAEN